VAWSITGAYAFSVIIGSLIAYLEEPPLPQVQVVEGGDVVRPDVSASTENGLLMNELGEDARGALRSHSTSIIGTVSADDARAYFEHFVCPGDHRR
jgi:hypothetical protein